MGHLVGKDLYRQLGHKLDGLTVRLPWSEALFAVLAELYSEEDARLIVGMPHGLTSRRRLERITGLPPAELERRLEDLSDRGLVIDILVGGKAYYAPSPMVIGIFEFTMMRVGADLPYAKWAELFRAYMEEGTFFRANFGEGQKISIMRALPHDGTVVPEEHVEVLDCEKATAVVESGKRFAMGLCSCRHEAEHLGTRACASPLDNCSTLGTFGVEFMLRHGFAREVSKTEMLENVARSRELGLVLNADNVQRNVGFICHCCGCCCNVLKGISRFGYPNTVVTSSFIAEVDLTACKGCNLCSKHCPIDAIPRRTDADPRFRKFGRPAVDEKICLGCGVCVTKCRAGAIKLHPRQQRVLHPETTFERVILQCLERGTLQNQLFADPTSKGQSFLRAAVGGFLRLPPVKQALMSELLRSRFLEAVKRGAGRMGKGGFSEL